MTMFSCEVLFFRIKQSLISNHSTVYIKFKFILFQIHLILVDNIPLNTEEVRRLEGEIFRQKKDYDVLQEEKRKSLEESQQMKKLHSELQAQSLEQTQKIKELNRQLEAKEELVKNKSRVFRV